MVDKVALIPARSGSSRIPDKNIYKLNGHPLMAYSICSAIDSKEFDDVIVSTDSKEYASIAAGYGARVILRPKEYSGDFSPDIEWVTYTIKELGLIDGVFSILRPTSPFRTKETIKRAFKEFNNCDSLRAVELCSQHPLKMWTLEGNYIKPYSNPLFHDLPYQALPIVYVQNASLEIANCATVWKQGSISGKVIKPFFTQGYEGFDINKKIDLELAQLLIDTGKVKLGE